MLDDHELIHRYSTHRAEGAFAELVRRHIDFVYATALRHVGGDAHHAADVTQYVFTELARKAASLGRYRLLAGWLYLTARNASANVVRADRRRQAREKDAHAMNELFLEPAATVDWNTLQPVIDDALCALNDRDREAVLLRFFGDRTFSEIGSRHSLSEDAVRLRVERALEKMRAVLARRGLRSTAAALATALANRAEILAPAGLAAAVTAASLVTGGAIHTGISVGTKIASALGVAASLGVAVYLTSRPQPHVSPKAAPARAAAFVGQQGETTPPPSGLARVTPPITALRAARQHEDLWGGRKPGESPFPEDGPVPVKNPSEIRFKHPSFTFVRISYDAEGQNAPRRALQWATDYPEADLNFSARFQQITGLKTNPDGKILALFDADLKQYPFIYMVEGGGLQLSVREIEGLRAYLLGGGFLMIDDFWGEDAWKNLRAQMKMVLPDREPVDLPPSHPIFRCFYELPENLQVPNLRAGIDSQFTGVTWEREDAKEAHIRGLFDDKNRLVAVFCHNTDLGDGWERIAENAYFYHEFTLKKAYPLGINIVVYALSQ